MPSFSGDTQPIPESVQKEVHKELAVALEAQASLKKQIERVTRNYLIEKGKLELSATKEEFEAARSELSPETISKIAESTKNNSEDLFLQMARQQYELDVLKNENALTGLANRRMADTTFELFKKHYKQNGNNEPMAVVSIDLDGFKMVNDTFGHDVGNEVLKLAGQKLKAVRSTDLTIHFSGDEFGLILTGLKPTEGMTLSQTVEGIVKKLILKIEEIKELEINGAKVPLSLSASAGFKIVEPSGSENFDTTNKQADSALEFSKTCKGVADLRLGSTRIRDVDKEEKDFLAEKQVSLKTYERSKSIRNHMRPALETLYETARKENITVTTEMIAAVEKEVEELVDRIQNVVLNR